MTLTMDMQGSRQLAITHQQAWDALSDPAILQECIPGCSKAEPSGENQYTIAFEGQGGPAGFRKGSVQVKLVANDSGTELVYTVKASAGGRVAQMGQRLSDGEAKSMAEDFFKRFEDEMRKAHLRKAHPEVYPEEAPTDEASADAASASAEPVPLSRIPAWVVVGGAAVVAALGLWVTRNG